jgi:RNA polymerase sigma factor (sigma-70 family)
VIKDRSDSAERRASLLDEFLAYKSALSRMLARILKRHDIDDVLQETFIRACAAAEKTEIRHPRSFMLKTARNLALNHIGTAYNRRTQVEDFSSGDVSISEISLVTESVEAELESREQFLGFCRAVRALPPQCRRVFVLRKVYGLTQQEIAAYLEISESTVEKHVVKGLLLCKGFMKENGYIDSRHGDSRSVAEGKRKTHG